MKASTFYRLQRFWNIGSVRIILLDIQRERVEESSNWPVFKLWLWASILQFVGLSVCFQLKIKTAIAHSFLAVQNQNFLWKCQPFCWVSYIWTRLFADIQYLHHMLLFVDIYNHNHNSAVSLFKELKFYYSKCWAP